MCPLPFLPHLEQQFPDPAVSTSKAQQPGSPSSARAPPRLQPWKLDPAQAPPEGKGQRAGVLGPQKPHPPGHGGCLTSQHGLRDTGTQS